MAPPYKRRRLTASSSLALPSPTLSHTVEQLAHRPSLELLSRPPPQRIEEVHLQIQNKAIWDHHDHHHSPLQRRQGTAVSSAPDSTLTVTVLQWADVNGGVALSTINDDLGGTYMTTQTLTLVSSPLPSSTTASSTSLTSSSVEATTTSTSTDGVSSSAGSEGFIGNSPSGASVSSTTDGSATSTGPSSAVVTVASISGPASNSTGIDVTGSSGLSASSGSSRSSNPSGSSSTSLGAGVFLATLSNGDIITVTRSDQPYATTFGDGRVSTISPSPTLDRDRSSRTATTGSPDESSETSQASEGRSTETSVNFVTGPNQTQQPSTTPTAGSVSNPSAAARGGGGGETAPPGTIAGGVVGGCAGLAVIVLVALMLLRWWKRKAQNGHHALPPSSEFTPEPDMSSSLRGQPGMAERAGIRPLMGAVPAFFRHSNRSSEPSVPPSERGFTRVSGRKLPSQFSAGISSPPPPSMPLAGPGARTPDAEHERNLSATSFYRDSDGFYGGEGVPVAAGAAMPHSPSPSESLNARGPSPEEEMTISPGPRRTPTVHRGGPYTMSPSSTVPSTPVMPLSPAAPSSGVYSPTGFPQYARSETPSSVPDNRSSRFTEEV